MKQGYLFFLFIYVYCFPSISSAAPDYSAIEFVENKGQWKEPFLFRSRTPNCDIYLEQNGFTFVVGTPQNNLKIHEYKHGLTPTPPTLNFHTYKLIFDGAAIPEVVTGSKPQQHYYNYFLGNDPDRWKTGLHPYHVVDYKNIYNGVDLHVASENGQLKYDFIVQPGTDVETIKLRFEGTNGLETENGKLLIKTSLGNVVEEAPYVYQLINGERREVACKYRIKGNTLSYSFPKGYDETQLLIIDPTVVFATFTGSTADNFGYTATYDNAGSFYAGGFAAGAGYPATTGAFQMNFAGGGLGGNSYNMDIAISKFNAGGTALAYATYLGGYRNEQPHSMVVDNAGNLIVVGRTYSPNFPTSATAYDRSYNDTDPDTTVVTSDIIITKFDAAGSSLLGSTYIGGTGDDGVNIDSRWSVQGSLKHNYGDDARSEVIIDKAGNIYVAAATNSTNFPTMNGSGPKGGQDGVVFKFNSTVSTLIWSTHLGGSVNDAAYVLALDKAESKLFVSGGTVSTGIAIGTVYQNALQGDIDGYIARFQNGGLYTLERLTYIGTSSYDQCYGIQVDDDNNVYAMGQTNGNFPVVNAAYSNSGANQFVIKLNNDLAAIVYSTVFGSTNASAPNISPVAFLVDTCQQVYISGWGGQLSGNGGNTTGMPVQLTAQPPALLTANTDGSDFYFIALAKNASGLLFAGYYGTNSTDPNAGEHVDGGTSRFDRNGVIYQAICGGCAAGQASTLPTTPNSYSPKNKSTRCNLAALKMEFNLGAVKAVAKAKPDAAICLGEAIQFDNTSSNATGYEWIFGDGSAVNTQQNPTYTYTSTGKFTVRMIAINPNACKDRDTVTLTITVDTNRVKAGFEIHDVQNCPPFKASFTNTSTYGKTPGASSFTKFIWNFGDNTSYTGVTPPEHIYSDSGNYTVTLVMIDTTACNSPDTLRLPLHLSSDSVKAILDVPPLICMKNEITFANRSIKGISYLWTFGDGDSLRATVGKHHYDSIGTYTIELFAYNPGSCNKVDSVEKTFTVKQGPTADFLYTPGPKPITNVPTTFTNISTGGTGYQWNFGDNTGSNDHTPPPHQFRRSGTYWVCLGVINAEGCADTICKPVEADVYPLADVPTAFSPNGDGNNDILYVYGAGIETMDFKIYNRWGKMIFESKSQSLGWDGTFNGKQQEMETYAFVLNITFIDGTTFYKKGNVTLIR